MTYYGRVKSTSPVGNRVKRTRPIQASPFYHHQLVHLYLRIFNFSFSSVFSGRGLCPPCDWATPIQSTVVVFCRILSKNYKSFCTANYWNLIGMIAPKLLIWFCHWQSKKKLVNRKVFCAALKTKNLLSLAFISHT